ncbi:MAG TPA: LacI family DNA-binding transcriptional regulator [Ruania sp.]|nr:LacI family DNA-binding transcriptional regulator [Ruania sp.]
MVTIIEVARRAGVSTATVSRVLNGKTVRADLAGAVRRAAAELNYAPDRTARSLRRRHSEVLALIIPDIENPFFTALARAVEDRAHAGGYSVVLCNTDEDPDKEARYLAIAESENMAGVLIAPTDPTPKLRPLLDRGRAVVVLDRTTDVPVDHLTFDNVTLGRSATEALLRRGYSRIACIAGPAETSTAAERAEGWRSALQAAGLPPQQELLLHTSFRLDGGRRATEELLALPAPPQALVASNNVVAVGALQVLARHGHSPEDLGVSIIGDLPFATSPIEKLDLIPLRPQRMGHAAADRLLARLQGDATPPQHVVLPTGEQTADITETAECADTTDPTGSTDPADPTDPAESASATS